MLLERASALLDRGAETAADSGGALDVTCTSNAIDTGFPKAELRTRVTACVGPETGAPATAYALLTPFGRP